LKGNLGNVNVANIYNNTIVAARGKCFSVAVGESHEATFKNNICFVSDDGDYFGGDDPVSEASNLFYGNGIPPSWAVTDVVNADPLFVALGSDDYSLDAGSPALEAGATIAGQSEYDLAGNPRVIGTIDIGAYERQS